ncbi:hypothetical protein COBT_001031 [Conglomerata obtusa]
MSIVYKHVVIDVPNKNRNIKKKYLRLVENACGEIEKGEFFAIMGPSGCGKTTFMSCLAGRVPSGSITKGSITLGGSDRDVRKWMKSIGFVDQDDVIFEILTVNETLNYAASFRLKNSSKKDIAARIDNLLEKFGLKHVKQNQMNKLSGGERKRVMIAIELICDPKVIFLDEPTSGLDTKTALTIIKMLKELTKNGTTVVVTIHQPSTEIFRLFDKLLLMSNGKTIYNGPAKNFEEILESKNCRKREGITFPDFIAEIAVRNTGYEEKNEHENIIDELIEEFDEANKITYTPKPIKHNEAYRNFTFSFNHLYNIFTRRIKIEMGNKWKNTRTLLINIAVIVFVSYFRNFILKEDDTNDVIYGPNYTNLSIDKKKIFDDYVDKSKYFNYNAYINVFVALLAGASCTAAFSEERNVIKREIAVGSYSFLSYFTGVFLFYVLQRYIFSIIFLGIAVLMNKNVINLSLSYIFTVTPIIVLVMNLAIVSIFSNRKLSITLTSFFTFIYFIDTKKFIDFMADALQIEPTSLANLLFYLTSVVIIIPYFNWTAVMSNLVTNYVVPNMFKNLDLYLEVSPDLIYKATITKSRRYILDYSTNVYYSSILLICGLIFYYSFGLYRQSTILKPKLRLQLEK